MARISFQKPTDQPTGADRLLDRMREAMRDARFRRFRLMVAFAKVGPLLRLQAEIDSWRTQGKRIEAVIGIDQHGTSVEALEFALEHFDLTHVAHAAGPFSPTFHPKLYLFDGDDDGLAFLGSNNLTVGGTETNLESHTRFEFDLPADSVLSDELHGLIDDALQISNALTPAVLQQLADARLILRESEARRLQQQRTQPPTAAPTQPPPAFPTIQLSPPSAVPSAIARRRAPRRGTAMPALAQTGLGAHTLVMQINPHHNGEVFLSKTAVDQDPEFFGWPFTGQTTPKRATNRPYPQRLPDPVVRLRVYDAAGTLIIDHDPFNLNTVYYSPKSEIRVTVPPDVVQATPDYSILVMQESEQPGYDYNMDIYVPGSTDHTTYLNRCNQTMPSGGRAAPRRFGWI